jgi:hypothetical protein
VHSRLVIAGLQQKAKGLDLDLEEELQYKDNIKMRRRQGASPSVGAGEGHGLNGINEVQEMRCGTTVCCVCVWRRPLAGERGKEGETNDIRVRISEPSSIYGP